MSDLIFLDTAYAIALSAPSDQHHERAVLLASWLKQERARPVTTRGVLLEIGNALADRARTIVEGIDRGAFKLPGTRTEREGYALKMIEGCKALRDAGRLSFPEFLHGAGFYAMSIVHEYRVIDGDYADELDPISEQIREVERAHGLREDEFWRRDEGPLEWRQLNAQYEAALERQQVAVLKEFGLPDLADLLEVDPKQFHDLWLRAVDAVDQYLPPIDRLVELIKVYRHPLGLIGSGGDCCCNLLSRTGLGPE